jgi:hypothetical protein
MQLRALFLLHLSYFVLQDIGPMAKRRGRQVSLDGLAKRLSDLDKERQAIQGRIVSAIKSLGVPSPFSWLPASTATGRRGRPAGSKNVKTKGRRKRRKMSAAARAKISAAQKKRWAKQKATAK